MEELSEELSGKAEFYNADSDENMGLAQEYRIVSIPAVIVLKAVSYTHLDGIHEGIISETDWELAHQKREKTGVKYEKTHSCLLYTSRCV